MPKKEQIVRVEGLGTYRLIEQLGDGMIAAVWRGEGEGAHASEQVAVKIAHPALSPNLQKQFHTEYDTLTNLLTKAQTWPSKGGKPPVPAFIREATLEPEGQDALVAELIKTETLSTLVLDVGDLNRRQELLVEPAYQYAWFLDLLHNRAGIRQSDRKLGDLYWEEGQERLIVLDWNVVEQGIERAAEDVYHFGEMWYALLLGVTPTLKLGVATSQEWERLSVAWRSVLELCLYSNQKRRPPAEELLEMLKRMRNMYPLPPQELLEQGTEDLKQAQEDPKDFEQAKRAWWLLDLAQQKGLQDAGELAQAAEDTYKQRGQTSLQKVKDSLGFQSEAAEIALEEAQGEMGDGPDDQLRLARWRCTIDAFKKSREEKISGTFRDVVLRLIAAVDALEADQWLLARDELKPALDDLPKNSETRAILDHLGRELALHLTLAEAVELRENTKFADAAKQYGRAQELLAEIAHQDAVEPNIADLTYEKAECERLAVTVGTLRDAQDRLPLLVDAGNYAEAKELYDEVLLLTRGKAEARRKLKKVFAPVRRLEALNQACQRPDTSPKELAEQAQSMVNQFSDYTAVQREIKQVVNVLLPKLERHAQEVKFIEDIDNALNWGQILQKLCESAQVAKSTLETCEQAIADLGKKREIYQEARDVYFAGDEARAAQLAQNGGVELFKDEKLSVAEINKVSSLEPAIKRAEGVVLEHKRKQAEQKQAEKDLQNSIGRFKQSVQEIIKYLENEIPPNSIVEIEKKIDDLGKLVELASGHKQELEELPPREALTSQIAERRQLRAEALLQKYLDMATIALRDFERECAGGFLETISDIVSRIPSLEQKYSAEIKLVRKEHETQCDLEPIALQKLQEYGKLLREDKKLMPKGDKRNLQNLWQQTSSIFIGELWNLAQPEQERLNVKLLATSEYQEQEAQAHKKFLGLLQMKKLDELQSELDQFDSDWRINLKRNQNSQTRVKLDEFINAWYNRITQVEGIKGQIQDIEEYLAHPTHQKLEEVILSRMERVIVYTSPEVFAVYHKECERPLKQLMAGLAIGQTNLKPNNIENIFRERHLAEWPIWKLINRHTARGKRFFALLSEQEGS